MVSLIKPSVCCSPLPNLVRILFLGVGKKIRVVNTPIGWYLAVLALILFSGCGSPSDPAIEATTPPTEQVVINTDSLDGPSEAIQLSSETPVATSTRAAEVDMATSVPTSMSEPIPTPFSIPKPPRRDLYELARSLVVQIGDSVEHTDYNSTRGLSEGVKHGFNILDLRALRSDIIHADLKFISDHAYWYVQEGLAISREELIGAALVFERDIYSVVTDEFGPLWPPEVPEGNRLTILHAKLDGILGYYSSSNEYPSMVHQYSNQRKMIYLNSSLLVTGSNTYFSTIAHELQHAINWNLNGGQSTWLNEGLSQLVEKRLGYSVNSVRHFGTSPIASLVYWPVDGSSISSNYGAAFLFTHFLDSQHGLWPNLRPLIETGETSGIYSVNSYLDHLNSGENFDSIFGRWLLANHLSYEGDGPFSYPSEVIELDHTDIMDSLGEVNLSQPQYSARYVLVDLEVDTVEVAFSGNTESQLLPYDPHQGGHCWWSNRGDSISTSLTREFDLSIVDQATLKFGLWYEIEENWDYGYVQVSTDDGATWDSLRGEFSTITNPVGNSFGSGYTGFSDVWVDDAVDLSTYAGKKILVRFQYVTDDALNGTGLCVDYVAVPEIGFFDDASWDHGWMADGFFRTDNRVPQDYVVWIIETKDGEKTVRSLRLDAENAGRALVTDLDLLDEVVVVVGSLSRGSSQPAQYRINLEAPQ